MDGGAPPYALADFDDKEEEVQTVQSKWLNNDGPFGVRFMLMQGGAPLRSSRQKCWSASCLGTEG